MEDTTVLPKELRLGVPPKMPQARSYLFRQQSTISSYDPEKTIQINIPRLQRSYLRKDSCLRFRVTGSHTAAAENEMLTLDSAGAFGFIERIEVFDYLGSTVLESISGVPQLSALLLDLGLKDINYNRNGSASMGLASDYACGQKLPPVNVGTIVNDVQQPATTAAGALTSNSPVCPPNTGATILQAAPTPLTARYFSKEFAIPLPSFLGLLSDKMIPLVNGFTIVITLANKATPFFMEQSLSNTISTGTDGALDGTTVPITPIDPLSEDTADSRLSWKVSDVFLNCQILELGLIADSMMANMSQGRPLVVHTKSFRNYVATPQGATATADGQAEFTLNMNLNVASLTNILWIMRPTNQTDKYLQQSYGHRIRNFLQRWYFQYGSTTLPQSNGIQAMGSYLPTNFLSTSLVDKYVAYSEDGKEAFNELLKSRPSYLPHSRIWDGNYEIDYVFNANPVKNIGSGTVGEKLKMYSIFPNSNGFYPTGKFACGLNLQLVNGKDGQIISGLNTNGMNTSIRGIFHPMYLDIMASVRVDAWAEYDAFINISPGVATTVSF